MGADHFLGYVTFVHEDLWGRIRPLARLRKDSAEAWVVERRCEPGEFGATDQVFWPAIPRDQAHLQDHYVRFRAEPNQRPRDPGREHDEFVVAEDWRYGKLVRRVEPVGVRGIPEDQVIGPERVLGPECPAPTDAVVYRRRKKDTIVDGPWKVARRGDAPRAYLVPKDNGFVLEHDVPRLRPETFHVWEDRKGEIQLVLLVEPPRAEGRIRDLLPSSGLADWLVRMLRRDKAFLSGLDRASPGWRGRIAELVGLAEDPVQRELDRDRFDRLQSALDALAGEEARLADLVESPQFKGILDAAIGREVASRREQIEAAAQEESRAFVERLRQEREQERARVEREKRALRREVDEVRAEVAEAGRQLADARSKAERDEASLRSAADYLVESRERIVRDFAAFHGLIEIARGAGEGPINGHAAAAAALPGLPSPTAARADREGPAIDDHGSFLGDRLAPALARWGADATRVQARKLHAALLACRWVATPCPSWGVAYAEAIGGDARNRVVAVAPTWLSFPDAWAGEVEAFWREALEARDALHILIFADADRALVQCWARPLLDVVSGLRPALPTGQHWPDNLRVMSCPAADEAALPVPDWVVAHWAGVKASGGATPPDGPIAPGHVPFAAWRRWAEAAAGETDRPAPRLGVASTCAAREVAALARVLRGMDAGADPDDAGEDGRRIRELEARAVFAKAAGS